MRNINQFFFLQFDYYETISMRFYRIMLTEKKKERKNHRNNKISNLKMELI